MSKSFLFSILLNVLFLITTINVFSQERTFVVKRGVNISHWLSQSSKRGGERKSYFTKKDVEFLASLGFDHLRIPMDEEQMWNEQGQKEKEAFELLHNALKWCNESNLKVVVDLHILRSHHFNAKEKPLFTEAKAQERFYQCWVDLSGELKKYPNSKVAYELMNEPVADDPEDWNKLVKEAVARLRKLEPARVIVIGSNRWQSADTFDQLSIPDDKNILLSFHFYSPMLLTHYKASWVTTGKYTGPVKYPGVPADAKYFEGMDEETKKEVADNNQPFTKETIESIIEKPVRVAKEKNLPLYCGEWGCFKEAPREAKMQWYKDVLSVLKKNNIGWAIWDYKGSFGIVDSEGNKDEELIRILTDK